MSDDVYTIESAVSEDEPGLPTTMLAQGLLLTEEYALTRSEDGVDTPLTFNEDPPVAGAWYRTYLAPELGSDGTEELPHELLFALKTLLGARWQVRLLRNGRVQITYTGPGVGVITWGTASVIRDLLGFTGASVNLLTDGSQTATFAPVGVLYGIAREQCQGWRARGARISASRAANGRVAGTTDRVRTRVQSWTFRLHPRTNAEAIEHESYATPLYPPDEAVDRQLQPSGPVGVAPPWSCDEFVTTALGRRVAMALSDLQEHFDGARFLYEVGNLSPDTVRGLETVKTSGNWNAFYDLPGFEVSQVRGAGENGTETR